MDKNKFYIIQNRKGWNFLRWLWLSTNLFITVKFHDIEKEIAKLPEEGGVIQLLPEEYLIYKPIKISERNITLIGTSFEKTIITQKGHYFPIE